MHIRKDLLARVEKAAAACTDLAVAAQHQNAASFLCVETAEIWQRRLEVLKSISQACACTDIEVAKRRYLDTPFASDEGAAWKKRLLDLIDKSDLLPLTTPEEVKKAIDDYNGFPVDSATRPLVESQLVNWFHGTIRHCIDCHALQELRVENISLAMFDIEVLARIYDEHWDELALPEAIKLASSCTDIDTAINHLDEYELPADGKVVAVWVQRWHELALEIARAEVSTCTDPVIAEQKLLDLELPSGSEAELLWREKFIELSYPE